jgi:adenylate cyclase
MVSGLPELRQLWAGRSLPPLDIRIGINTGRMVIGNMGAAGHLSYTVMGEQVNLAARLEEANKDYGTRIILSEQTRVAIGEALPTRELDILTSRGFDRPVRIYELLDESLAEPGRSRLLEQYDKALQAFRAGQFGLAETLLAAALDAAPDDGPAKRLLELCRDAALPLRPSR